MAEVCNLYVNLEVTLIPFIMIEVGILLQNIIDLMAIVISYDYRLSD